MGTVKRISGDYDLTTLSANANINFLTTTFSVTGNTTLNGTVSTTGNVSTANLLVTGSANVTSNLRVSGQMSASGNVIGAVFIGDGSGLTGVAAGNALGNIISYGVSQVAVPLLSGDVYVNVAGVSNVAVFTSSGMTAIGNVTGNTITGNYWYWGNGTPFTGGGTVKYDAFPVAPSGPDTGDFWFNTTNGVLYQYNDDGDSQQWVDQSGIAYPGATTTPTANVAVLRDSSADAFANTWRGTAVSVTGNVTTSGYFLGNGALLTGVVTSVNKIVNGTSEVDIPSPNGRINFRVASTDIMSLTTAGIENLLGNATGNIGNSSAYWNRVFATSTSALYADLAENYLADNYYDPGTVVIFGGENEITISTNTHDTAVAGVVSENPSYLMNAGIDGVPVALTGKVKCKVQGPVNKGTLLTTSNIPGVAERINDSLYRPGCVIGKSLEVINDSSIHVIDIAVGRF